MPVFVILPVNINALIGSKAVPQVIHVCSCVGKCWSKGYQGEPKSTGLILCKCVVLHLKVVCFIFMLMRNRLFL